MEFTGMSSSTRKARMPKNGDNEPGKFDAITHLFIRDHLLDDGSEPRSDALPFWLSPDITVIDPGGMVGEPVALQKNEVRVRVTNNGGIEAVDAWVDIYSYLPTATGVFPVEPMNKIGEGFITVPARPSNSTFGISTFSATWVPTPAEAGHRCLLARVQLFPQDVPANLGFLDPGDRHIAQRNCNVIYVSEKKETQFGFVLANPIERGAATLVRIRPADRAVFRGVAATLGSEAITFAEDVTIGLALELGDPLRLATNDELIRALNGLARRQPEGQVKTILSVEVEIPAKASVPAILSLSRRDKDPRAVPIEILHSTRDGILLGGITVVLAQPQFRGRPSQARRRPNKRSR
jgi:hypothetical protein